MLAPKNNFSLEASIALVPGLRLHPAPIGGWREAGGEERLEGRLGGRLRERLDERLRGRLGERLGERLEEADWRGERLEEADWRRGWEKASSD